jgi:2-methylcitrate dehydratase PrpD
VALRLAVERIVTDKPDLGFHLANYIVDAAYEDLPADAVDAAKKSVLDLLGVILAAGAIEPAVGPVMDLVRANGGPPRCTIIGYPDRAPAAWAAFANGAMAHSLDFDDLTPWGAHSSSSIIPASLAVAESQGGVTGKDLITAIAVGQDLFARMRHHVEWRKDWNISTVFGVFAATAAAGRLLGLSPAEMSSALGIAAMQAGGTMDAVYGLGGDLRCIYAAFSAKAAVVSAMLAKNGILGTRSTFSGEYGFFATYFGGRFDPEQMVAGLGKDFTGSSTLYKPWPAVGPAHSHIHATIRLVSENELTVADIDEIRVYVGDYHQIMCSPLDERRAPATLVDAKFSLPFLVAVAAVHRDVAIGHFVHGGLRDPVVLAVADKVVPVVDPAFDWKFELPSGRVEILTRDGRTIALTGTEVPGSPESPMTWADLQRKFSGCAAASTARLPEAHLASLQRMAAELESVADVSDLLRLLRQ